MVRFFFFFFFFFLFFQWSPWGIPMQTGLCRMAVFSLPLIGLLKQANPMSVGVCPTTCPGSRDSGYGALRRTGRSLLPEAHGAFPSIPFWGSVASRVVAASVFLRGHHMPASASQCALCMNECPTSWPTALHRRPSTQPVFLSVLGARYRSPGSFWPRLTLVDPSKGWTSSSRPRSGVDSGLVGIRHLEKRTTRTAFRRTLFVSNVSSVVSTSAA